MSLKSHTVVLPRINGNRIAVVECEGDFKNNHQVMLAITKAVTNWINHTRVGKIFFIYTCRDLNIADLDRVINNHSSEECTTLTPFLTNAGILNLKIELFGSDDAPAEWTYDTVLYNGEDED